MDLTIPLENITLNIRVAVLIENADGFILEKNKKGFYFPIGGRIKAGESSLEAAKRETLEELGVEITGLKLKAIAELFFDEPQTRFQEICFIYTATEKYTGELAEEFTALNINQINDIDFRPQILKQIMTGKDQNDTVLHLVSK
jgi:8-oxo-dGTP pyrophosphatase MutT (NUDIX family)